LISFPNPDEPEWLLSLSKQSKTFKHDPATNTGQAVTTGHKGNLKAFTLCYFVPFVFNFSCFLPAPTGDRVQGFNFKVPNPDKPEKKNLHHKGYEEAQRFTKKSKKLNPRVPLCSLRVLGVLCGEVLAFCTRI
jgi:hypothetical protein